jgi:DNA-binding transcriptional LysR family regulator
MIFIREPQSIDASLAVRFITRESCVLAVPIQHALAQRERVAVVDFQHEAMIIPDRRTRPHSHDLTMSLFKLAGLTPHIAQFAEEKQTILSLVSAGLGLAVVPASYRTMNSDSVCYIALDLPEQIKGLPLSIAWQKGNEDAFLLEMLRLLHENEYKLTETL